MKKVLYHNIHQNIAARQSVLVDATHIKRSWRVSLTQYDFGEPIKWIGWWLQTPLKICLEWNRTRNRQVPEDVIYRFVHEITNPILSPQEAEGFSRIIILDPSSDRYNLDIKNILQTLNTSNPSSK